MASVLWQVRCPVQALAIAVFVIFRLAFFEIFLKLLQELPKGIYSKEGTEEIS